MSCALVWLGGPVAAAESAAAPAPPLTERVLAAAASGRQRLEFDGNAFSGPAWRTLVEEGRGARFFLLGEQHGIAENAELAAALFGELAPAGYAAVAIETSPPMAAALEAAVRDGGLDGLRALYGRPGGEPAFFGMLEESRFLVAAVEASPEPAVPVLWGLDYEVASDRHLLRLLSGKPMPPAATEALAALEASSAACWESYHSERHPRFIYSFCGDPEIVRALEAAWPGRDPETARILDALEETLEINRLWAAGQGWRSNARRAAWLRANFLTHWRAERAGGRKPRVLAKFGASHMVRGLSTNETFDLGTLLPEVAALEGGRVFSLLVVAGAGSTVATFDPVGWSYRPAPPRDGYTTGLEPLIGAAFDDAFTLIDLRPLRPLLSSAARGKAETALFRTVHGFDALLVMTGSTPSAELDHPEPPG